MELGHVYRSPSAAADGVVDDPRKYCISEISAAFCGMYDVSSSINNILFDNDNSTMQRDDTIVTSRLDFAIHKYSAKSS